MLEFKEPLVVVFESIALGKGTQGGAFESNWYEIYFSKEDLEYQYPDKGQQPLTTVIKVKEDLVSAWVQTPSLECGPFIAEAAEHEFTLSSGLKLTTHQWKRDEKLYGAVFIGDKLIDVKEVLDPRTWLHHLKLRYSMESMRLMYS